MIIYLLLPLPSLIAALLLKRIDRNGLALVWFLTAIALVALMPVGSRDFNTYLRDYDDIGIQPWSDVVVQDPLYATAVWLCGRLGVPSAAFYLCLGVVALAVKLMALHRLCKGRTLPIALYMSSYFFLHDFTQVRAGLAIGIWMFGLSALPRNRARYLGLTLLASLVHVQAALGLVMFPLVWVLDTRFRLRVAVLVTISLLGISIIGLSERIVQHILTLIPDPRVEIYLRFAEVFENRLNPLNIMSLIALATAIVGLWPRQKDALKNAPAQAVLNQRTSTFVFVGLLLGSCSLAAFASVPIAAQRISEHFFALLPVGMWFAADHLGLRERRRQVLWLVALLFLYIFLIHSPYLLDPSTGQTTRED